VLTSNLGSQALSQLPEGGRGAAKRDVMDAVRAHFRPEFLNRLDEMIIFDRLSRSTWTGSSISSWAAGEAAGGAQDRAGARRGARKSGWPTKATTRSIGARPLKRVIQRALQDPLAEMLLAGEVMDGDTVHVSAGHRRADRRRPGVGLEPAEAG
jgi:ATP-dependent Clp protease ATP-binding subunit ClpB